MEKKKKKNACHGLVFTENARRQLGFMQQTEVKTCGFVLGDTIGSLHLVTGFFPCASDTVSLERIYPTCLDYYQARLLGVFCTGNSLYNSEWFREDLILEIRDGAVFSVTGENHAEVCPENVKGRKNEFSQ